MWDNQSHTESTVEVWLNCDGLPMEKIAFLAPGGHETKGVFSLPPERTSPTTRHPELDP